MNRLLTILTLLFLTSCSCEYDKTEVMNYFSEIENLNQILIGQQNRIDWKNHPDSVSTKIKETSDLISLLKDKLDLTEIEKHNIDEKNDNLGLAYRFGKRTTDKCYSFLIFAENKSSLASFSYYEQFSDCAEKTRIDNNWTFSIINNPDCNN